jgi:hypothetical protein
MHTLNSVQLVHARAGDKQARSGGGTTHCTRAFAKQLHAAQPHRPADEAHTALWARGHHSPAPCTTRTLAASCTRLHGRKGRRAPPPHTHKMPGRAPVIIVHKLHSHTTASNKRQQHLCLAHAAAAEQTPRTNQHTRRPCGTGRVSCMHCTPQHSACLRLHNGRGSQQTL